MSFLQDMQKYLKRIERIEFKRAVERHLVPSQRDPKVLHFRRPQPYKREGK
jgi:hypothetical protein